MDKSKKKISFLKKKYIKQEISPADEWVEDIIRGFGKERERFKLEIPIYGDISLDEDERNAMVLPPKTAVITEGEMEVQEEVCKAKIRYGRRNKLIGGRTSGRKQIQGSLQQTEAY